jgi:hypothetical protein
VWEVKGPLPWEGAQGAQVSGRRFFPAGAVPQAA